MFLELLVGAETKRKLGKGGSDRLCEYGTGEQRTPAYVLILAHSVTPTDSHICELPALVRSSWLFDLTARRQRIHA